MKLLYVKEHLTCRNYVSDFHVGFQYNETEAGSVFEKGDKYYNHLIFIIDGTLSISRKGMKEHICMSEEMFFIGRDSLYILKAKTDIQYLLLSFDNPISFSDYLTMDDLQPYAPEEPIFKSLLMCEGMLVVVNTIKFYMHHKIQCKHLHAAKQQEVFMILANFYSKEELAYLFHPILDNAVDFKTFIINNYQDVKTVEELARLCNLSVRSLTRKFHDHFGDSPYSWILKQRSQHIKMKIIDPKVPFSEIIHEFGFSSPAHFTSFCKKFFGESPSKLRKKQNERLIMPKRIAI